MAGCDARPVAGFVSSPRRSDVRLNETAAVDEEDALACRDHFSRESDDALDERGAPITQFHIGQPSPVR